MRAQTMQARFTQAARMRDEQRMPYPEIAKAMGLKRVDSARTYVYFGRKPGTHLRHATDRRRREGHATMAEYLAKVTGGWTEAKVATLKQLWPTHSASQIAKRVGTTKNAVIGKAHRLGLEPKRRGKP